MGASMVKKSSDQFTGRELFWFSAYILGIALIPILIAFGNGILFILLNR